MTQPATPTYPSAFTRNTTPSPSTVGEHLNDNERVQACLEDAITYFHDNLPDRIRTHIKEKWGISNEMINARRIGFTGDGNDVIEHLRIQGHSNLTIARADIGTPPILKHIFECNGVHTDHEHLIPDNWERGDHTRGTGSPIDKNCPHTVPPEIDALILDILNGTVPEETVNLHEITAFIEEHPEHEFRVWNWWDNRITFPYKNQDGTWCYLIGRATSDTDDIVYNNGITDRTSEKLETVADTRLSEDIPVPNDVLEDFVLIPHYRSVYANPVGEEHHEAMNIITDIIVEYLDGELPREALLRIGVTHEPGAKNLHEETRTARINVIDTSEDNPVIPHATSNTAEQPGEGIVLSPAALGVIPGDTVEFTNLTNHDADIKIAATPDGVWWDGGPVHSLDELTCSEPGMYRYRVTVTTHTGETVERNGIILAYDNLYTDRRSITVERWVENEPGFDIDLAKYVKQAVDRAWINHDIINEPIFGCETVHDGKPLLVTEGVTDAITAHQHNIPCVAPATTNFKRRHYDRICELAENVPVVYVVNDHETNDAGINGALRTGKVLENNGHTAIVCDLPRPENTDKIDIAEYFKTHTRIDFITDVLEAGTPPEQHEKYDEARHNPQHATGNTATQSASNDSTYDPGNHASIPSEILESDTVSAIYKLELHDVINFNALSQGTRGGTTLYRGPNPIQHHGNTTGYFVIRDHGEYVTAKDYKIEGNTDGYYYNALTWLACEATCDCPPGTRCGCTRSVTRPMGSLTNSEVFWVWKHAKETPHIPVPSDDSIPKKAMWYIANRHDLLPGDLIPESHDDDMRLPASVYNRVLHVVKEEYGLNPGRKQVRTTESR